MLCTVEEIEEYLKKTLSPKRFDHCLGVYKTMKFLFSKYGFPPPKLRYYKNLGVSEVVGLMHDAGRELDDQQILAYAKEHGLELSVEMETFPVLAHGLVAHDLTQKLIGPDVPQEWLKAMDCHTTGSVDMGYIGMVLFVADFIEPTRKFMTDEKRQRYLAFDDLNLTAAAVLEDMTDHWKTKGMKSTPSSEKLLEFFHSGKSIENV